MFFLPLDSLLYFGGKVIGRIQRFQSITSCDRQCSTIGKVKMFRRQCIHPFFQNRCFPVGAGLYKIRVLTQIIHLRNIVQECISAPVAHGRWEWFDEETGTPFTGYEREWGWKCSYCGEELPDDYDDPDNRPTFRFCHSCGAKMDGGVDDAAD